MSQLPYMTQLLKIRILKVVYLCPLWCGNQHSDISSRSRHSVLTLPVGLIENLVS